MLYTRIMTLTHNTVYPDLDGRTQLHVAVRRGDARVVEVLLASGADVDAGALPLFTTVHCPLLPHHCVPSHTCTHVIEFSTLCNAFPS